MQSSLTPFLVQIDHMKDNPMTSVLSDEQLRKIMLDMQIYTYGLATLICVANDSSQELSYYQKLLREAGSSMIGYHLYSSGKIEAAMKRLLEVTKATKSEVCEK